MSPQAAVSPRSGNAWLRGAPTCALDTDEVASWCNGELQWCYVGISVQMTEISGNTNIIQHLYWAEAHGMDLHSHWFGAGWGLQGSRLFETLNVGWAVDVLRCLVALVVGVVWSLVVFQPWNARCWTRWGKWWNVHCCVVLWKKYGWLISWYSLHKFWENQLRTTDLVMSNVDQPGA